MDEETEARKEGEHGYHHNRNGCCSALVRSLSLRLTASEPVGTINGGFNMHEMWLVDLVVSVFIGMMVSGWVYDKLHTN